MCLCVGVGFWDGDMVRGFERVYNWEGFPYKFLFPFGRDIISNFLLLNRHIKALSGMFSRDKLLGKKKRGLTPS